MDKELFDDLVTSCKQAIAYEKGDKSKGRTHIISNHSEYRISINLFPQEIKYLLDIIQSPHSTDFDTTGLLETLNKALPRT